MKQRKIQNIIVNFTKTILYTSIIALIITGFVFCPKTILTDEGIYTFSASVADIENSAVLFNYEVYGSQKRFEEAFNENVPVVKQQMIEDQEVLMVKVHGDQHRAVFAYDYWFVESPETPKLNIEYYIVTNLEFLQSTIPCHTFIDLFTSLSEKINVIYLIIVSLVSFGICIPFGIGVANNSYDIYKYFKNKSKKSSD